MIPRVQNGTAAATSPGARRQGVLLHPLPARQRTARGGLDFYQQLYFHELGTPSEKDRYELGKDFPRIAEIQAGGRAHGPAACS